MTLPVKNVLKLPMPRSCFRPSLPFHLRNVVEFLLAHLVLADIRDVELQAEQNRHNADIDEERPHLLGNVHESRAPGHDVPHEMELPCEREYMCHRYHPVGVMGQGPRKPAEDEAAGDEENHAARRNAGIGCRPAKEQGEHPHRHDVKHLNEQKCHQMPRKYHGLDGGFSQSYPVFLLAADSLLHFCPGSYTI